MIQQPDGVRACAWRCEQGKTAHIQESALCYLLLIAPCGVEIISLQYMTDGWSCASQKKVLSLGVDQTSFARTKADWAHSQRSNNSTWPVYSSQSPSHDSCGQCFSTSENKSKCPKMKISEDEHILGRYTRNNGTSTIGFHYLKYGPLENRRW